MGALAAFFCLQFAPCCALPSDYDRRLFALLAAWSQLQTTNAALALHLANKFTHIHYQYCSLRFTNRCENIDSGFGRLAACMAKAGRAQHDA